MRMRGLYAILDQDVVQKRHLDWQAVAEGLIRAEPAVLQLRAKSSSDAQVLQQLSWLRARLGERSPTLLFANDRADLALWSSCDGVHVGQEDLPVHLVREKFPSLKLGLSTHNLAQWQEALHWYETERLLDYVALGPIFATSSKQNPDPEVGVQLARELAQRSREKQVPLVVIGGISEQTLPLLADQVDAFALIGALLPKDTSPEETTRWVETRCRQLQAIYEEKQGEVGSAASELTQP